MFTLPGALGPIALAQPPRGLRPADAGRRGDPPRGGRRTRSTSGPRSACWRCCTPGARTSRCTRTSIASSPAAGSRPTGAAGSPAATTSSCRSASSAACSGASSSAGLRAAFQRGRLRFPGRLAALARPGAVPPPARRDGPHRMGRVRQAAVRRARDGAEVPGAVHAPGGHQQPPPGRPRGRPGHASAGRTTPTGAGRGP